MEKYYMVTEECSLHKAWFGYKENKAQVNELFKEFKEKIGFESSEFYVTDNEIYIVPTEKDVEAFGSVLCGPINDGLRKFRTTSKVGKAWVKDLKDADLKVESKPMVILYFRSFGGGRYRSRVFDQNGNLYCSIDPVDGEAPKGFVEMKASEFFQIIEESEKEAS
ncbi:hypothetical protein [Paenibacillus glucanolyticus]|uniref:hypothetical protein n=1 Tax=Paenibacillus glucanolyticus TaxID=59843 RepID=UPI00096CD50C|nr:hypothetical protein [Paenibacillus glucanolyticus]OMF70486.1 hypothetical protein BK142_23720 [Paenibacillus glucanolyticus]